jgi:hypothetical protein
MQAQIDLQGENMQKHEELIQNLVSQVCDVWLLGFLKW